MMNYLLHEKMNLFFRYFITRYMIDNDIEDEKAAIDEIKSSFAILLFDEDESIKKAAEFIKANLKHFDYEKIYPVIDDDINSFDILNDIPIKGVTSDAINFTVVNGDNIDFSNLARDGKLSESIVENNIHKTLVIPRSYDRYVEANVPLSKSFLEKYSHLIHWETASRNQVLSEDLIERFADKVDFKEISRNNKTLINLSNEFFVKHKDQLDIQEVLKHKDFDFEYLKENFMDKPHFILRGQPVTDEFVDENIDTFKEYLSQLSYNENAKITDDFIEKHYTNDNLSTFAIKKFLDMRDFNEKFLHKLANKFSKSEARLIFQKQKLSSDFIETYSKRIGHIPKNRGRNWRYSSKENDNLASWEDIFYNTKIVEFNMNGTHVIKDVANHEAAQQIIFQHKGPLMISIKNTQGVNYIRTNYNRSKNTYSLQTTYDGYKGWKKECLNNTTHFHTIDEIMGFIKEKKPLKEVEDK